MYFDWQQFSKVSGVFPRPFTVTAGLFSAIEDDLPDAKQAFPQ